MVEVVKSNFRKLLPAIQEAVKNCSFIAIDTEFTGLDVAPTDKPSFFDSLEDRYRKLVSSASNFVICQLGMTIFTKLKDENKYSAHTFNFYLRPFQCGSNDKRFLMQASCVDFLTSYNFDFNKFAYEGISYLNEVQEEKAKQEIEEGTFFIHHLGSVGEETKKQRENFASWVVNAKDGEEKTLPIEQVGHEYFQLYAIRWRFPLLWAFVQDDKVIVRKVSLEEKEKLQNNISEEEQSVLDFYLGFSHLFKTLMSSKKIIVGHNCLMDLLLIYNSFYRPLPGTFMEFKQSLNSLFPFIYDTKHMWLNVKKFYDVGRIDRKSGLYELYELFKTPPDNLTTLFCPAIEHVNCEKYASEFLPHDAGYDSFVTGWVFLRMSHILAIKRTKSLVQIAPQSFRQYLTAIKPFENKINITRCRVHFIDLTKEDKALHRPQVLYVRMKSGARIKIAEVAQRLRIYGHLEAKQIGKSEALVAVASFGCAEDILRGMSDDEELHVDNYSLLHHWWPARVALWLTAAASGGVSLVLLYRLIK